MPIIPIHFLSPTRKILLERKKQHKSMRYLYLSLLYDYELSFLINSFTLPRFTKRSSDLCRPAITVHKKKSVLSQFSCRLQLSHGGLVLNETNSCSSSLIITPFISILVMNYSSTIFFADCNTSISSSMCPSNKYVHML